MTTSMDYVTVVEPVHEVTLIGHAEYAKWDSLFHSEGLFPEARNDRIELILSAVDSRYMGIQFKEFSVSSRLNDSEFFLLDAYNSLRLFAWAERTFFQTPYYHGHLLVQSHHLDIRNSQSELMFARLPETAPIIDAMSEVNEWKIWLPKKLRKQANTQHYFHARLEGRTQYFDVEDAQVNFGQNGNNTIFDLLNQSGFQLTHWLVRETAIHSKSKIMP